MPPNFKEAEWLLNMNLQAAGQFQVADRHHNDSQVQHKIMRGLASLLPPMVALTLQTQGGCWYAFSNGATERWQATNHTTDERVYQTFAGVV